MRVLWRDLRAVVVCSVVLKLSIGFGQASASALTLVSAKPSSNPIASVLQLYYIFMASLENCMHSFRHREYAILKRSK